MKKNLLILLIEVYALVHISSTGQSSRK